MEIAMGAGYSSARGLHMTNCTNRRFADELAQALERPIPNRTLGRDVGTGDLDYERYLRTKELYALQIAEGARDEHLFQVMHQTQELWLKQIAHDAVEVVAALDGGSDHDAAAALGRIILIQRALGDEMRILETVTPKTFQVIRRNLGNGSGLQSPGYARVTLAAEHVTTAFERRLGAMNVVSLYATESDPALLRIAELLVDWDEAFQTWLVAHFMLVRRTIGVHRQVRALDGFPTQALGPRMTKPLFPALWDARVEMTKEWSRDGGYPIGHARVPA